MNNVYEVEEGKEEGKGVLQEEGKEENPTTPSLNVTKISNFTVNKIQRAACPKKEEEEEEEKTRQGPARYRALSYLCYSFKCKNRNEYIFTHFRWIVDN